MFGKKKTNTQNDKNMNKDDQSAKDQELQDPQAADQAGSDPAQENQQTGADKVQELQDKYLRLYSEFENFRRRTNKEKQELIQFGNKDLLLAVLPIYDDFERALSSMEKSDNKEAIMDGVRLIFNKFTSVLQNAGLKPIESKGKEFDAELHDAITKIPAPSADLKGKVVDEVQKGYTLNDKIIRHSKVVVGE
jgi:molecular chaperone GrpE